MTDINSWVARNLQGTWFHDLQLGLLAEAGDMFNSGPSHAGARNHNGQNFGQLLSPYANEPMLNQLVLNLSKPVDDVGGGYGLGFTIQALYGSDARIYQIAGIDDRIMNTQNAFALTQAHLDVHMPWLSKEGLDGQMGILMAPMGVEVLDPTQRAFYTLANTSEFSVPFEHVGLYFQQHINSHYQIMYGLDAGNQVSFGRGNNNGRPDGYFGFSGTPSDTVTFTGLFRVGPEDAWRALGRHQAHDAQRYWYDLNASWKANSQWTFTGELNHVYDEGLHDNSWSAVAWAAYHFTPTVTFNARGEVYRDQNGALVAQYPGNTSYMRAILGLPNNSYGNGATTYGDLSFNMVWRPTVPHVAILQLRPEIRFDRALNNTRPFADFTHRDRILVGGDVTVGF
ncbi:outer membrane beta-barrel protein [Formicincola oecophyllae]|uniref:Outer membrane beta-barrel protein n=2 Tax=Formicincola oecophyllae TaxID=2558361 RepID=A0A4Y6UAB1_9PROT|nr:outer membrane beta-barrel protein [Formicincola oecophyllae]